MVALAVQRRVMKVPAVIPPRSVVRLVRYDDGTPGWAGQLRREFRVGYYRPGAGLDVIWLVNDRGEYEQSVDRDNLLKYFDILSLSRESDLFGKDRPPLRARTGKR